MNILLTIYKVMIEPFLPGITLGVILGISYVLYDIIKSLRIKDYIKSEDVKE